MPMLTWMAMHDEPKLTEPWQGLVVIAVVCTALLVILAIALAKELNKRR